jgi:hypothetical protein
VHYLTALFAKVQKILLVIIAMLKKLISPRISFNDPSDSIPDAYELSRYIAVRTSAWVIFCCIAIVSC